MLLHLHGFVLTSAINNVDARGFRKMEEKRYFQNRAEKLERIRVANILSDTQQEILFFHFWTSKTFVLLFVLSVPHVLNQLFSDFALILVSFFLDFFRAHLQTLFRFDFSFIPSFC